VKIEAFIFLTVLSNSKQRDGNTHHTPYNYSPVEKFIEKEQKVSEGFLMKIFENKRSVCVYKTCLLSLVV
jgi:hypothetical protein